MIEAGWSARQVARQLGHADCVVRRCWDQWIRDVSLTRRPGSGRHRHTSRREGRHIVRNTRVQPTAPSAAIQAKVAPSLKAPVSFRTMRSRLTGEHFGSRRPLSVLPLTPIYRRFRLEWCRARGNCTAVEWNQVVFSDESRFFLSSDDNRVRASILPLLYSNTPLPPLVTATAGSDVIQSGRPIFDDFFQHLWPYIGNNTANVVFQMVKRLWLIRIDQ
ncbi:transposable element Tcb2 transposase [Trichonephila clavipes]|nr:transposable element Tcb2 transposase [Trichonephila clavipes]